MTFYGGKELAASFRAAPGTRTVAGQLVHIATAPRIQEQIQKVERRTTLQGFNFPGIFAEIVAEENKPRSKQEILALLEDGGEEFAKWLETLPDDFLGEQVGMPAGALPVTKSRFEMLLGVKEHEMHHRAQVMLMQRMLGIVPHGTRAFAARLAQAQKPAVAG